MPQHITKGELARRERLLEGERKFALRDYLIAQSLFEDQLLATMTIEASQLFENEWRKPATKNELTDITAVSKAELEVYYPRETSMSNGYRKSLNRNFYDDMSKQSLPLELIERTMQPGIIPNKHMAKQLSAAEREIATRLRDIAVSTIVRFFSSNVLCTGAMLFGRVEEVQPRHMGSMPTWGTLTIVRTSTTRCWHATCTTWTASTTIGTTYSGSGSSSTLAQLICFPHR